MSTRKLEKTDYFKKVPTGQRKTFAVVKRITGKDGSKSNTTIADERIDSVNRAYLNQTLTCQDAFAKIQMVVDSCYAKDSKTKIPRIFSKANQNVITAYWEAEYSDRDLIDPATMKNDLQRAVRAIGKLSLHTASKDELKDAVNKAVPEPRQNRRVVARLNQLLRHLGSPFKLRAMKKQRVEVKHLSFDDFERLAASFETDSIEQTLVWAAFGTGCRIGELFSLNESSLKNDENLRVLNQLDKDQVTRETKNRTTRRAFVIPEALKYVKKWLAVPMSERRDLRNKRWAEIVKKQCQVLWPDDESKHLVFHDLHHKSD